MLLAQFPNEKARKIGGICKKGRKKGAVSLGEYSFGTKTQFSKCKSERFCRQWFANEKGKVLLSMHLNSTVVLNVQVSLKKLWSNANSSC